MSKTAAIAISTTHTNVVWLRHERFTNPLEAVSFLRGELTLMMKKALSNEDKSIGFVGTVVGATHLKWRKEW